MITTALIYILNLFIGLIVLLLPSWSVWPSDLLTGLSYFCASLAKLNFIFPIDSFFTVLLFIVNFEILYFTSKIIMKVFNYLRGTGSGLDL
jgi:uncharacterized membrane protein